MNKALRRAIQNTEREYIVSTVRDAQSQMPELFKKNYPYKGTFKTSHAELTSASTVVVSTLVPVLALLPGGTDGSTWFAATIKVPSGSPVSTSQLFAQPSEGLKALSRAVRQKVLARNRCVRKSVMDPVAGDLNARGFRPVAQNYRYFALVPQGLAIGFPLGQVAGSSCGRVLIVVSSRHPAILERAWATARDRSPQADEVRFEPKKPPTSFGGYV